MPPNFFGVHENLMTQAESPEDLAVMLDRIRELNLSRLRFSISWRLLFDVGSDCSYNHWRPHRRQQLHDLLGRLPARIEIEGIISQPPSPCRALYKQDRAAFRAQFTNYVTKVVSEYKDRVRAWDVWSEPNAAGFYLDPPGHNMWTVEQYFQDVFYSGATAIRHIDPSATIVLGNVALNGVVGHRCKPNGMRRGRPCPPAHRTGYYVRPNFYPDLFAYFNAHPEYKPYSLFDVIALHPYYWTRFRPAGGRYRKLTYVPPSVVTYGPGGLIPSIATPQGKSFGVWWTELNEKLRLRVGNTQEGQAKRFYDILEQALVDSRRKDFPLQAMNWFSLRDRGCLDQGHKCMVRERDRSGKRVRHIKWSGLIAYGTRGEPQSHIPRKVFYTYKHFVADHTRIDYLIDDFASKSVNDEAFDNQFWEPSCTALNTCDSLFAGPGSGDMLRMQAPGKTYGPWTKVALASRHHIEIAGKQRVYMSFDFSLPASADGDGHYAVVSSRPQGSGSGGTRRVHARHPAPGQRWARVRAARANGIRRAPPTRALEPGHTEMQFANRTGSEPRRSGRSMPAAHGT